MPGTFHRLLPPVFLLLVKNSQQSQGTKDSLHQKGEQGPEQELACSPRLLQPGLLCLRSFFFNQSSCFGRRLDQDVQ